MTLRRETPTLNIRALNLQQLLVARRCILEQNTMPYSVAHEESTLQVSVWVCWLLATASTLSETWGPDPGDLDIENASSRQASAWG